MSYSTPALNTPFESEFPKNCPHFNLPSVGGRFQSDKDAFGNSVQLELLREKIAKITRKNSKASSSNNPLSCNQCSRPVTSLYMCLSAGCNSLACGRDDKQHALEHYSKKQKSRSNSSNNNNNNNNALPDCHAIAINVLTLQCWCYACDTFLNPSAFASLDTDSSSEDNRPMGNLGDPLRFSSMSNLPQDLLSTRPRIASIFNSSSKLMASSGLTVGSVYTASAVAEAAAVADGLECCAPTGIVGLYNLGNSCYMNAAIQSLLACPSILGYFRRCGAFVFRQPHRRVSESFLRLVQTIYAADGSANGGAISPNRLVRAIKNINPMFHGYSQQDTMDFVRCILDRIHDELKRPSPSVEAMQSFKDKIFQRDNHSNRSLNKQRNVSGGPSMVSLLSFSSNTSSLSLDPNSSPPDSKGLRRSKRLSYPPSTVQNSKNIRSNGKDGAEMANQDDKYSLSEDQILNERLAKADPEFTSIVSDTFSGILRSQIYCQECRGVSIKDDPFCDVSVPISSVDADRSNASSANYSSTKANGQTNGKGRGDPKSPNSSGNGSFGIIGSLFSSIGESMGLSNRSVRLEACLSSFCAPERLEGKERYRCEKCARLVSSQKTLLFQRLPQVLILQLKRFRHETYFSSKVNTQVIFPLEGLDMSPFLTAEATKELSFSSKISGGNFKNNFAPNESLGLVSSNGAYFDGSSHAMIDDTDLDSYLRVNSDNNFSVDSGFADGQAPLLKDTGTLYNLAAVISHRGTFSGGHYVAYCRAPSSNSFTQGSLDGCLSDQWLEYDDATVTPVSAADVAKVQAYALFYHRHDASVGVQRGNQLQRISAALSGGDENVLISRQWYNRWRTMTYPGPMDNSDVGCKHGNLRLEKDLLLPIRELSNASSGFKHSGTNGGGHLSASVGSKSGIKDEGISYNPKISDQKSSLEVGLEDKLNGPSPSSATAVSESLELAGLVHPLPKQIYSEFYRLYGELSGWRPPSLFREREWNGNSNSYLYNKGQNVGSVSDLSLAESFSSSQLGPQQQQQPQPSHHHLKECRKCHQEEEDLMRRRIKEELEVCNLDSSFIPADECWYLIDCKWLQAWGLFKGPTGQGPPPGPINNSRLAGPTRQEGLVRGKDYRGINERVWRYFLAIYGGGPAVPRRSINLYTTPVVVTDNYGRNGEGEETHIAASAPANDFYVDVVGQ